MHRPRICWRRQSGSLEHCGLSLFQGACKLVSLDGMNAAAAAAANWLLTDQCQRTRYTKLFTVSVSSSAIVASALGLVLVLHDSPLAARVGVGVTI